MYWFLILIGISDCSQKCFLGMTSVRMKLASSARKQDQIILFQQMHMTVVIMNLFIHLLCGERLRPIGMQGNTSVVFTPVLACSFGTQANTLLWGRASLYFFKVFLFCRLVSTFYRLSF